LRVLYAYKFDSDLLVVEQVRALKDHAERTLSNFLAHPVVYADDVRGGGSHNSAKYSGLWSMGAVKE